MDTLTFFPKNLNQRSWPLDDLWPHVSWGHMCDSTQGSLCPSPMTVHQCVWIQWSILQNTTYIHTHTYYIHTTYYVQNEWSHSLLLNSVSGETKRKENGTQASRWKPDQTNRRVEGSSVLISPTCLPPCDKVSTFRPFPPIHQKAA